MIIPVKNIGVLHLGDMIKMFIPVLLGASLIKHPIAFAVGAAIGAAAYCYCSDNDSGSGSKKKGKKNKKKIRVIHGETASFETIKSDEWKLYREGYHAGKTDAK